MADIPINSKYVKGGFIRHSAHDADESYIAEMMAETEEKGTYSRYDGPIYITGKDDNVIPVPSENKGRYRYDDQEEEAPEHIKELWASDGNLFKIEAANGKGIIRRGMHIRYVRKSPRNFVKGGFINHINSTYISFRYAKGSSVVQLNDIDHLYVDNIIGKKKKTEPVIPVVQYGGDSSLRKKINIVPKEHPATDDANLAPAFIDPLTGKKFRDTAHLRQFTSSKKYAKLLELSQSGPTTTVDTNTCPQCMRKFRDSYTLKRHMASAKYASGSCI